MKNGVFEVENSLHVKKNMKELYFKVLRYFNHANEILAEKKNIHEVEFTIKICVIRIQTCISVTICLGWRS